jgi:hypothetical protein
MPEEFDIKPYLDSSELFFAYSYLIIAELSQLLCKWGPRKALGVPVIVLLIYL